MTERAMWPGRRFDAEISASKAGTDGGGAFPFSRFIVQG